MKRALLILAALLIVQGSAFALSPDISVEGRITATGLLTLESGPSSNIILSPNGTGITTTAKQMNSTLATGTAPITTTSTTACTNLNADLWDGWHASGEVILLYASEESINAFSNTINMDPVESWTVPANPFSRIMVESEIGLFGTGTANAYWRFTITYAGTDKRNTDLRNQGNNGADLIYTSGSIKYSEPMNAGGLVKIKVANQNGGAAAGTWYVRSFRVYGII